MALFKSDVHVDAAMSQLSVEYKPGNFVADKLFPTVKVTKDSDYYFVYTQGDLQDEETSWEQGSSRPHVEFSLGTETYAVVEHAPTDYVTEKARRNADDPLDLDRDTTMFLTNQVMLNFERDAAVKATTTSNYNASLTTTLSGTDQWSDLTNSDPIGDIQTGIEAILGQVGVYPTGMLIGQQAWTYARQHPTFLDLIKHTQVGLVTPGDIATFFNFEEVLIGTTVYNTAADGATVSMGFVWGDNVVIYCRPPGGRPGRKTMQYGVTFKTQDRVVERWYDSEKKADFFSVLDSWAIEFTAQDGSNAAIGGYLIYDTVA